MQRVVVLVATAAVAACAPSPTTPGPLATLAPPAPAIVAEPEFMAAPPPAPTPAPQPPDWEIAWNDADGSFTLTNNTAERVEVWFEWCRRTTISGCEFIEGRRRPALEHATATISPRCLVPGDLRTTVMRHDTAAVLGTHDWHYAGPAPAPGCH